MGKVSPEAVNHAAMSLKKKYESMSDKTKAETPGGINALAGIMNHLNSDAGKRLMDSLDSDMPEFADEVRRKITIYEFESIVILSNKEIRLVLERVKENRTIAKALKGAADDLKYKIIRNMSTNRADDVISLMDLMGPLRLSEVTEARTYIVTAMRDLSDKGLILLRKEGEDLVE
jgi:flagellar motor switch protein FliG